MRRPESWRQRCSKLRLYDTVLHLQQCLLAFDPPAITSHATVLAHDAMAWDRHRHWIRGAGAGHGANRARPADTLGHLAVRTRRAEWNRLQVRPDPALKRCGANIERHG